MRRSLFAIIGAAAVCAAALVLILVRPAERDGGTASPSGIRAAPEAGDGPPAAAPAEAPPPHRAPRPRPPKGAKPAGPAVATIEGSVQDDEGTRPGALVVLHELLDAPADPDGLPYREIARTIAIEHGSFRFERVARIERAFMVAISPGRSAAVTAPFAIDAASSAGRWDLVVGRGRSIDGVVVSRDGKRSIGGARIRVASRRPIGDGSDAPAYNETQEVWSFEGGAFGAEGVPEGSIDLVAEAPGFARLRTTLGAGARARGIRVDLAAGASISGVVRDGGGREVANALVRASVASTREHYETHTRDDGTFDIESLTPGDEAVVEVVARPDGGAGRLGPLRAPAAEIEIRLR